MIQINCLFLDIGGVLLTDGWSHEAGKRAARAFGLNPKELDHRHAQALDTAQVTADRVVFIDKTPMFVSVAARLGIHGLLHTDYPSTRAKLAAFGLEIAG